MSILTSVARDVTAITDALGTDGDLFAVRKIVETCELADFPHINAFVDACNAVARHNKRGDAYPTAVAVWTAAWLVQVQRVADPESALSYAKTLKDKAVTYNGDTSGLDAAMAAHEAKAEADRAAKVKAGKTIPALKSSDERHIAKSRQMMVAGAPVEDLVAEWEAEIASREALLAEAKSRVSVNA
jgi:hypothetical protein